MVGFLFFLLAAAAVEDRPLFEASLLDGSVRSGVLIAWETDRLILQGDDGAHEVPLETLQSLKRVVADQGGTRATEISPPTDRAPGERSAPSPGGVWVELVDGTRLVATDLEIAEGKASLSREGDAPPLQLAADRIRRVQLQPLSSAAAELVDRLRERPADGDWMVINKQKGESADYIVGVVQEVNAERVLFAWEEESLEVNRAKAAAVGFYRPETTTTDAIARLHFSDGSEAAVSAATLVGASLKLRLAAGSDLELPLAAMRSADLTLGKLVYLSDLSPVSARWTPLVAVASANDRLASIGAFRRDQSFSGDPLSLWTSRRDALRRGKTTMYRRGLAVRSRTELIYDVPRGMERLIATAGIDPRTSAEGNVTLEIFGDRKSLWRGAVDGPEEPQEISVALEGARRLRILADYGDNLDVGDRLHLVNARLSK